MPIASVIPDTEAKRSLSVKLQGLKPQRNRGKCGIFRQINWLNDLLHHRTLTEQTTKRSRYLLQWKFRSQVRTTATPSVADLRVGFPKDHFRL